MPATPVASEVLEYLDGYGIDSSVIPNAWIEKRRDNFIIPWIELKTRQSLSGVKTNTEYVNGTGSNILILSKRPIVALTDITLIQSSIIDWNINLSNVEVISEEGILKAKNLVEDRTLDNLVFPRGTRNLKIEYTYGYDNNVPVTITEAITLLLADQVLMILASRTGGGKSSKYRSYGERGRYTEIREDLARQAHALLKTHMTGVSGG